MLKPGSSPVDWCESNYIYSPFIAEYANTVSNVLFFALPPVLIWLFQPYANHCNRGIYVVWGMLIVVGACSVYFHATLSLLGQLLDELAILWVFSAAFAIWFPSRYLPQHIRRNRSVFQYLVFVVAAVSSVLAFLQPAFNAFALMTLGVPTLVLMISELSRCDNTRVLRLGTRCGAVWILAVACWVICIAMCKLILNINEESTWSMNETLAPPKPSIPTLAFVVNDKMFCETWSNLNFPYLHAFWHVLIFIASYTACVLFAYFDAKNQLVRGPDKWRRTFSVQSIEIPPLLHGNTPHERFHEEGVEFQYFAPENVCRHLSGHLTNWISISGTQSYFKILAD